MSAASVLLAPACLSKPERPSGAGHGADGGGPGSDSGYDPDSGFLLRRQVAVGDLDGDGIEDAVLWGNAGAGPAEQGQRPIIRVYFGGEAGLAAEPDIDMRFEQDRPWYEVLDVAIERSESLGFLTAEDLDERDSPPPHVRRVRAGLIPVAGKLIGAPVFRSQDDLPVSGYVDDPAPAFIWNRQGTVGDESRLVFGFADFQALYMPAPGSEDLLEPAPSTVFLWDEGTPVMQEGFTVDDGPVEDLVVVTRAGVGRTVGDAAATQAILQTAFGASCDRIARGRAEFGTFYGLASCQGDAGASLIVSVNPSEPPAIYPVDFTTNSMPTDLDIFDIGGVPQAPDVLTIEEDTLVVYGDLFIGPPVGFDWGDSMAIEGYDLLAVGHFHSPDTHQIYLFSATDPETSPRCLTVDADTQRLVDCS